jgi:DNA-3-methyladenine glycosylase
MRSEKRHGHRVRGASPFPPLARAGWEPLPPAFYSRPAEAVARALLGAVIVSEVEGVRCAGRIVETEAYTGPDDDASHGAARIGRTRRNAAMFGPPGYAYVYRIYGVHWCLNAVTDSEGHPAAVLIRAAEPLEGIEIARERRRQRPDRDLMRGPGNLCAALGVTGTLDQHPLDRPPLTIVRGDAVGESLVRQGPRIGVTRAADLHLRFWVGGSPWVSARA